MNIYRLYNVGYQNKPPSLCVFIISLTKALIKKATGKGIDANTGMLQASAQEMMDALGQIVKDRNFEGLVEKQANTFEGMMGSLTASWDQFMGEVGKATEETQKVMVGGYQSSPLIIGFTTYLTNPLKINKNGNMQSVITSEKNNFSNKPPSTVITSIINVTKNIIPNITISVVKIIDNLFVGYQSQRPNLFINILIRKKISIADDMDIAKYINTNNMPMMPGLDSKLTKANTIYAHTAIIKILYVDFFIVTFFITTSIVKYINNLNYLKLNKILDFCNLKRREAWMV